MHLATKLVLSAALLATTAHAKHPNIVLILVDDMGYGDAACFNPDSKIPTPHIDSLARDGLRFTDAHAPGPLCHMSRYGLMTGRFPFRTDVSKWPKQPLIAADQTTVPSLLKTAGYQTHMVGKWHLGFKENGYQNPLPGGPVDVGFDSFFGIRASTDIPPYFYIKDNHAIAPPTDRIGANYTDGWTRIQGEFWRAGGIAPDLKLHDVLPRFTGEAVKTIDAHSADTPLFLYLAYPAPHTPWLPSEEFDGSSKAGLYGDFVTMVDAEIGKVLATLAKKDLAGDTLVIFTSDNGPVWYEEDVERLGHDSSGGLRGMKADTWEAGHRMPFIARWPGTIKPGSTTAQTICFTDILATAAALTDTKLPQGAGPDSFSFLHLLEGEDKPVRPSLTMASGNKTFTHRSGPWKLITALGSGGFSKPSRIKPSPGGPTGQLYNLDKDPAETTNLYQKHPKIVARLSAQLEAVKQAD